MKILKTNINTADLKEGADINANEKAKSPTQLVFTVVDAMVQAYMQIKGGFDEADRRMWYKIEDAFDAAIKDSKDEVALEDSWMGWLKKVRAEAKMRPVKLMRKVDEMFDQVSDR